ncbi:dehydrogenase [Marisediminicola sp. LYQ134]|uniref:dehydrogenase n=1 Tax=Marisediminicola sp. LYQ134 TaxID=3391061 RepID=UPI003983D574
MPATPESDPAAPDGMPDDPFVGDPFLAPRPDPVSEVTAGGDGVGDPSDPPSTPLSSPALIAALAAGDSAAVAFALRNEVVIVPLLPTDGAPQVRVFRAPDAELFTLLVFSTAENYAAMLPQDPDLRVLGYDRSLLTEFLELHLDSLETMWFDPAGPFPMQADPTAILKALKL